MATVFQRFAQAANMDVHRAVFLDRTIQSLKARFGDGEEVLSLLNMYHNLLRQWTEV